jgi:hypothetical protein
MDIVKKKTAEVLIQLCLPSQSTSLQQCLRMPIHVETSVEGCASRPLDAILDFLGGKWYVYCFIVHQGQLHCRKVGKLWSYLADTEYFRQKNV